MTPNHLQNILKIFTLQICIVENFTVPSIRQTQTKATATAIKGRGIMSYRINERNIGNSSLDATPKNKGRKLNLNEYSVIQYVLEKVYEAMEQDDITGTFTDGGRIVISLTGEQMFDFFEAKRKLKSQFINQKLILKSNIY